MPELPEVETTVRGLNEKVKGRVIKDVWTDVSKIKLPQLIIGKKIIKVSRRAKNVVFDLTEGYSLLVHQKMTGHLLYGNWEKHDKWVPLGNTFLNDPYNRFIHLILFLDKDMIALSDLRKFAKVELWKTKELEEEFRKLGPEPLEITFEEFKKVFKKGKIKAVLMNPEIIAGIGNIYSSEALWYSKIHPLRDVSSLKEKELKLLYDSIQKVLTLGIQLGGESFSDYRKPDGSKGDFDTERKAYKREGEKCYRCGEKIKRLKIGGRSAFFCPKCQK